MERCLFNDTKFNRQVMLKSTSTPLAPVYFHKTLLTDSQRSGLCVRKSKNVKQQRCHRFTDNHQVCLFPNNRGSHFSFDGRTERMHRSHRNKDVTHLDCTETCRKKYNPESVSVCNRTVDGVPILPWGQCWMPTDDLKRNPYNCTDSENYCRTISWNHIHQWKPKHHAGEGRGGGSDNWDNGD